LGTASFSGWSCLVIRSSNWEARPVMFPPGRARLCTSLKATGSVRMTKTMGIVLVAF